MAPKMRSALVVAAAAALVSQSAASDLFRLDRDALRQLYSAFSSRSPIDRRLADPSEDDLALREDLEVSGVAPLCVEGILRNVGTEDAPEIGCCHPDCYMCMAQGCGSSSPSDELSALAFPGVAPQCCYSFFDWRVQEDRGISSRECSDAADVGCMLPESYNDAVAAVPRTDVVVEFTVRVTGVVTEDNFCTSCVQVALANAEGLPSIDSVADTTVTNVATAGTRRRLQGAASKELSVTVAVHTRVGEGQTMEELQETVQGELAAMEENPEALAMVTQEFVAAVDADASISNSSDYPLKDDLKLTTFSGINGVRVGSAGEELEAEPEAQSSSSASVFDEGPMAGVLAAFVLVVLILGALYMRRRRERAANATALLDLKVGRGASFRDVVSEDSESVYLPPVLPGHSSACANSSGSGSQSGSSTSSGHRPRAWDKHRRPGALKSATKSSSNSSDTSSTSGSRSRIARSVSSVSSISDTSGIRTPAGEERKAAPLVRNELDALTRPHYSSRREEDDVEVDTISEVSFESKQPL